MNKIIIFFNRSIFVWQFLTSLVFISIFFYYYLKYEQISNANILLYNNNNLKTPINIANILYLINYSVFNTINKTFDE